MNTYHLFGVAALFMLSACASGNREGRVQHTFVYPISSSSHDSSLSAPQVKKKHSSGETIMACGQVLSFWAGHLR